MSESADPAAEAQAAHMASVDPDARKILTVLADQSVNFALEQDAVASALTSNADPRSSASNAALKGALDTFRARVKLLRLKLRPIHVTKSRHKKAKAHLLSYLDLMDSSLRWLDVDAGSSSLATKRDANSKARRAAHLADQHARNAARLLAK